MDESLDLNNPETSNLLLAIKKLAFSPALDGISGNDLAGFSDEELNSTYATACQQVSVGQLRPAAKLFAMLIAMRSGEGKYWRGLALCMHRWNLYPVANFLYSGALDRDPDDVVSRVFRAEVLFAMKLPAKARTEAQRAIDDGKRLGRREDQGYVRRAEKLIQFMHSASEGAQTFEART
jgi:predicted Zn-dependent protease